LNYKYLFGPVPSRRLGISLGVDVVPYKVCSLGCIYCECGETTEYTLERKSFFKASEIINELNDFLSGSPELDYITFSGGGEPTLYSEIGEVIDFLKDKFPYYKIALLTNGSLLNRSDVRKEIKKCDLIIPSIDAVSQDVFEKINRPCSGLNATDIIDGIKMIKDESLARIWVELFIVPGINDTEQELRKLKDVIVEIKPDKIQLNTLDRPGAVDWVRPAEKAELEKVKEFFGPLNVEIVKKFEVREIAGEYSKDFENEIVAVIKRRPCTIQDLMAVFKIEQEILLKYLRALEKSGRIISKKEERGVFYRYKDGTE
jgi:wyosine [tRNA(Phe)-imidazoG37] synthetase (radical SAM superfamily)